jgi:hypothetical protein
MTEEVIIPSNKRLCQCGHCDEWIDVIDKYGKPRFYKKGHRKYRYINFKQRICYAFLLLLPLAQQ